ncbi:MULTISPECIES: UDP-N-acetylmuramoyl-tripeptide--D-alanyl-D-alanine ligase [Chitinophaga]|uniref:UDP-N-acetylmuramoyl-tripeptide--D-alanyl-D- alanine ligase n=1 Tax=Chitinophaga TaxID=79328 RepID=UPI000DBAC16C|nr:UDP-N-acetylmuramoyl-tripeptide--D-alanyl-D-alanine ligase [Chitinophaga ginsengisegetis]MDR6565738.1 UDP-N-acetylmuramoyl-tripeptide--D-alanyl-D-alanine ligase [Chitinophaga ginsengisegetis]MDR6645467.1 UDP-N-acetylmuramoyl-tripeptide--D-alanyl-D-alanine ligase [Chitinophaga ginsengisegetis]MDR6651941.1 UDP-N-acetylmuramoyl-tripeptide--D-alanyl-D-alanine ligase [Chitinophaga ginsengisegetis]
MNIEQLYSIYEQHRSVQTDTRKLKANDIFFALKGGNFNGNEFAARALELGAAFAVVDEAAYFTMPDKMMLVDDALTALQQLALHHRKQLNIPFLAITGTNGKTTTKELINAALSAGLKTYATVGNLNNHIGVPLTILSILPGVEIAVVEMGANHQKEIAGYCEIALPTHGIITNIGKAHLEGFGSEEGVKKAKGELYDFLRANNGTVFVCNDYDYLLEMAHGIPEIITYGSSEADYVGEAIADSAFLAVEVRGSSQVGFIQTQLVGAYNFPNVMAAVAVASHFNVPESAIAPAIAHYTPSNNRSQVIKQGSNTIIMDAYNANPSSMRAAIENFAGIQADKKILLLGAMMELGTDSVKEHQELVNLLERSHWEAVVLVGGDFKKVTHPYIFLENSTEAGKWLQQQQYQDAHILIKGSRSTGMEKVLA